MEWGAFNGEAARWVVRDALGFVQGLCARVYNVITLPTTQLYALHYPPIYCTLIHLPGYLLYHRCLLSIYLLHPSFPFRSIH